VHVAHGDASSVAAAMYYFLPSEKSLFLTRPEEDASWRWRFFALRIPKEREKKPRHAPPLPLKNIYFRFYSKYGGVYGYKIDKA